MKKVLLSGGAGFIGSHLAEKLLKIGYKVICVDNLLTGKKENIKHLFKNKNFKFIRADIAKFKTYKLPTLNNQTFNLILHFASPAGANPYSPLSYYQLPIKTYLVNSLGTHYLLQLCKKIKAEFIFASTSEVYGDPLQHPQKETYFGNVNPLGLRSCYDESKRFGEMATMVFKRKYKLKTKIIRIFNTYGPRMNLDDGRVIPFFINQALKNQPLIIFGSGKQTRSFCYIDDLIDGIIKIIKRGNDGEVYNLGNPQEITIKRLAEKIILLTNSQSKIIYKDKLEDDPQRRLPDINNVKKTTGWQPKINLEEGLKKTIKWFKNNNA